MSDNDRTKLEPQQLAMPVPDRRRANMYETIARVHKDILQVKWRAQTAGKQFGLLPSILPHLEESLAFLAEEILALQAAVEKDSTVEPEPAMIVTTEEKPETVIE